MKKKTAKIKANDLAPLIAEVRSLILSARHAAASTVNTLQVMTNFEIGRRIVEHEQKGEKRAAYGAELLKELSARLTDEFGRGFSEDNLARMRAFYITWNDRVLEFPRRLRGNPESEITPMGQKASAKLTAVQIGQQMSARFPLTLSWAFQEEACR